MTTGKADTKGGYFNSLGKAFKTVVGDERKRSRRILKMFLRQNSWVMLTDYMWVARRRKGFRITCFLVFYLYGIIFSSLSM